MTNEMTHSIRGASGAGKWMNCPGSIKLCASLPKPPDSIYAAEGTEAHFVGEYCLRNGKMPTGLEEGVKAFPSMEYISDEMLRYVDVYARAVRGCMEEGADLIVEEKFKLDWLYPDMFGTNDACVSIPGGTLYIHDLKYGNGIVDVKNNPQLMYYALGGLGEYNSLDYTSVIMTITQPRPYHEDGPVRSFEMSVEELYDWGYGVLLPAAEATEAPDAPLCAGPWCDKHFCSARGVCPEIAKTAMEVCKQDFEVITSKKKPELVFPPAATLTPSEVARVMEFSKLIVTWTKEVAGYAMGLLERGEAVPGYKLVQKKTNRKWKDEKEVVKRFEMLFGDEIYKPKVLQTPAQVEKLVGKDDVKDLWEKPKGGVTIAPLDDKRKTVDPVDVKNDFKPVNEEK